jgi:peroxiredoxin
MTLRTLVCTLALMASTAAFAALKPGDPAPAFSATASLAGKPFTYSLKDSLAKGPVVVYFYPSAYTQGCNIQAHEFSTQADYCAGRLAVASDGDGRIARSFGLRVSGVQRGATDTRGKEIDHGFTERTTFVVKRDGTVFAAVGGVSPEENVARALELVRTLSTAR